MDENLIFATPAEVAAREGISKQAVTKLVRRLVDEHGLPVERDGRGRVVKFSLAHYDHLRGHFASSVKVAAARTDDPPPQPKSAEPTNSSSRDEALRQDAWLKVGREKLRLQEDIGQLVRADMLRAALTTCGREINSLIARLPNRADDLALAVSKEGVHGLRVALRRVAFEISDQIADRLSTLSAEAPATDPITIEADEP